MNIYKRFVFFCYKINFDICLKQVNKLATKLVFMEYRSCITLSEITIYYNICDSYRVDKMILPINGISKGVNQAKAKCIENAESMNVSIYRFIYLYTLI